MQAVWWFWYRKAAPILLGHLFFHEASEAMEGRGNGEEIAPKYSHISKSFEAGYLDFSDSDYEYSNVLQKQH